MKRSARWIGGVVIAALVGSLLVAVGVGTATAPAATAATPDGWDPGYIIDDSIFYDGTSMSAGEVQSFLNSQVANCQSGYTCLKDYGSPTETRPADRYCAAYAGSSYQTAAQIIDAVARACSISQRVLIVLLQKEQGLVTSTAPSARAFSAATGMSCPDTAGCDPRYAGFYYQVYFAARQYQVYRLNPTSFSYQAQRWNDILLNPNRDCGTQSVYIANAATAGLYIYTPYTPNAAALANLYGIGDACSAYGNRNFWRIFSDWFGDPHRYTVAPGFAWYWDARGGLAGIMGKATSYLIYGEENGGGYYQRFAGATLYTSTRGTTAIVANNEFGAKYNELYASAGPLGWPTSEQMCASNGVCFQSFLGGTITSAPGTGAHVIWGGLADYWSQNGGPYGALGAALTDSQYVTTTSGAGWAQRFQNGTLTAGSSGLIVVPKSSVEALWTASGGVNSGYGWPTSAMTCAGTSCAQSFQVGVLSSTAAWGAHAILWGYLGYWQQAGGMSDLGAALDDLRYGAASGGGWMQQFATAAVTQRSNGPMIRMTYGAIYGFWLQSGSENGYLGWPIAAATCTGASCSQQFQGGIVTSATGVTTNAIIGGFTPAWQTFGGMATVGPATTGLRYSPANGGGWAQQFSAGSITQMAGRVPVFTTDGAILRTWYYYGAEYTWLGWPVSAQTCAAGACTQNFQNGVARSDVSNKVSFSVN